MSEFFEDDLVKLIGMALAFGVLVILIAALASGDDVRDCLEWVSDGRGHFVCAEVSP